MSNLGKLVQSLISPGTTLPPAQATPRVVKTLDRQPKPIEAAVAPASKPKKAKSKLAKLQSVVRSAQVNWPLVVQDLVEAGFEKKELSYALGLSSSWANGVVSHNTRKMDYSIGVALRALHLASVAPELHAQRFKTEKGV